MTTAVEQIMSALIGITEPLPVGTNLALLHFSWMLTTGKLLPSRGALFPGLQATGLEPEEVRRAWAAFRGGVWRMPELLESWREYVSQEGEWQAHEYEGYRPKAVDITGFWRPTLQNCPTKHYHPQAGKALPAINMGLIADVGNVGGHRVPLLSHIIRANPKKPSEKEQMKDILRQVDKCLAEDEIGIFDAGFSLKELQEVDLERHVVRQAKNRTFRRNYLPEYKGKGAKPKWGEIVRLLGRKGKKGWIPASPPDKVASWESADGRPIKAHIWDDLVRPDHKPNSGNPTVRVVVIFDPRYRNPWLLVCSLKLTGKSIYSLYRDRWPVEQPPLAAKQMLGAARQFVSNPESCQRLPELALLAGGILTYVATTMPATPTGFWDRRPRRTPGRLRRVLEELHFPKLHPLPERLRKKESVTDHLPKGILGHRRVARAT